MLSHEELKALPELVQEFLRYQGVIKNRSKNTIRSYSNDLMLFFRFLLLDKNPELKDLEFNEVDISGIDLDFIQKIDLNDAYSFMSYIKYERKNSVSTQARRTVTIRNFFKYLTNNKKLLDENPMLAIESPSLKKSLPKYLSLEQSQNLLESIDGKNFQRDYCIITFFLNCGLRLSELVSLNHKDISPDKNLNVLGKGSKERTVYLNKACMEAFEAYMKYRREQGLMSDEALFLSNRNKRISNRTVQHIVSSFLKKAGLGGQGFSTHKLRHTAATLMYQYGDADILALKEILGHENIATTEIYTHIHDKQLKKAMESNPLANVKSKQKNTKEKP